MFKLLKLAIVLGALAAVWRLVPVGGRTLHARWQAAGGLEPFARGAWAELDRALASPPPAEKRARAEAAGREPAKPRPARPTEGHTERDRAAVDRILADHLKP